MMKRALILLLILFSAAYTYAVSPVFLHTTVMEENPCPAYYADTNVTYAWDGNHKSGVLYGCKNDGTAVLGTDDGSTTGTDYGENGSIGLRIAAGKNISWLNMGQFAMNGDAPYTVWVRIYVSATCDNQTEFFEATEETTPGHNNSRMNITTTANRMLGIFEGNNDGGISARGSAYTGGAWENMAYSWDPGNADHSANTNATWEEDIDEIQSMTQNIYNFMIGNELFDANACGDTEYINIDRIVVISGYEAALPANWSN